jgi:hypothetical protein
VVGDMDLVVADAIERLCWRSPVIRWSTFGTSPGS